MFIIIRKNNTILSPEPTEMETYITGEASCGYKSLGVGTLLYVFNSRFSCNGTIISSVGPWVQIYKSEETFSKKDTLIVPQRLRINFCFFSPTESKFLCFGAQETKAQQPC